MEWNMFLKKLSLIILILFNGVIAKSQEIDVTEPTIKLGEKSEEFFYFGFAKAKGDKIIFNFSEIENKELKEIEINQENFKRIN